MAELKVLYVCFELSHLVSCELALLEKGYDVTTVLGPDGVIARSDYSDCALIVLDDGVGEDREFVERWLKENYPSIPVVAFGRLPR